MIAKERDASASIAALEELKAAHPRDAKRIEGEIRKVRAGLMAEDDAAYFIDFTFAKSRNYAVIHDLRLEFDGRVAHIDHLVVSRTLRMFVLETKSFRHGLKITEEGEFLRWNDWKKTYEALESPLHQCDRHIAVLSAALRGSGLLPRRLGIELKPRFTGYVLIQPTSTIQRPERFDTSRVLKSDAFSERAFQDMDAQSTISAFSNAIWPETLADLARGIASLHSPITIDQASRLGLAPAKPAGGSAAPKAPAPVSSTRTAVSPHPKGSDAIKRCWSCGGSDLTMLRGRFGYYLKCECGTNTSPKLPAGTRLSRQGNRFVLVDAEGNETPFHENMPPRVVDASEVPYG